MVAVVQTHPIEMPHLRLVPPPESGVHDNPTASTRSSGHVCSYTARRWVAAVVTVAMIWLVITTATTLVAWTVGVGEPALPGDGATVTHTIAPGDSVWSVARQYQPSGDVRPFVDEIVGLNGGTNVYVGQELVLVP